MGFLYWYLTLPKELRRKRKWSFFRSSVVYPTTTIEIRKVESFNKNNKQERI